MVLVLKVVKDSTLECQLYTEGGHSTSKVQENIFRKKTTPRGYGLKRYSLTAMLSYVVLRFGDGISREERVSIPVCFAH
jgi:hypothetical protein